MAVIGAKGNLPGSRGSFEDDAEEKEFVCTQVMEFCHVSTEKYGFKACLDASESRCNISLSMFSPQRRIFKNSPLKNKMKGSLFTGCDAGGHCSWHPARHDWSVGSPGKLSSHRTNLCS